MPCEAAAMAAFEGPELIVADAAAWRAWLGEHFKEQDGAWLVLAKKGTLEPTSLRYGEALEEALCHGWIDGQKRSRDETTFRQRFTPRRPRSMWSQRNVGLIEQLTAAGRMHPQGIAEVERAKADGRWEAAYAGPAKIEVPADLAAALAGNPVAAKAFEGLDGQNRYAILHRLETAKRAATRTDRIAKYVEMLERGETLHPRT